MTPKELAVELRRRLADQVAVREFDWNATIRKVAGSSSRHSATIAATRSSSPEPADPRPMRIERLQKSGLGRLDAAAVDPYWPILEPLVGQVDGLVGDSRVPQGAKDAIRVSARRMFEEARLLESWKTSMVFYRVIGELRSAGLELRDRVVGEAATELAGHLNEHVFGGRPIAIAEGATIGNPQEDRHDFEPRPSGAYRPICFRFDAEVRKIKAMLVSDAPNAGAGS